ncbi:L,D-transpeptidase family protein [Chitinophaga rhizophila]|uniref:L,D-transpeptidase family protein n=1 Tax=Chitinophaga rhizophila TaxID=2866212 RepID=A0ABS7GF38_9BACT|nr:L,D-transpeptidase family protein [Chitinophaga rhizophila]MBW8686292.1 L,D-transpeptidase family protein [Chitinophaga rhizophila]
MFLRCAYLLLSLMIIFSSCGGGLSKKKGLVRDTSHYTRQDYIDLTLDSNAVNSFLQADTAYADYIRDFYRQRNFHYAWIGDDGQLTEQAGNFINMMKADADFGLHDSTIISKPLREMYDTLLLEGEKLRPGDKAIPKAELLLTAQFFAYGNKVWSGLTSDSAKSLEWFIPRKKINMESLLDSMVSKPADAFEEPVNRQYKLLRDQLKKLAALEKKPWDSLKASRKIYKTGEQDPLIAGVKQRLHMLGDLVAADTSQIFTPALDSAIRNFQDRTGLKTDGTIQQPLLNALNITPNQRIRQILINMERIRWVPAEPPAEYLLVNIPAFKLYVYADNKLDWTCNVVVGRPGTNTVIFSNEIKFVVFAPYWNVPPGILVHEVLPAMRKNSGYLARQNMEVVTGTGSPVNAASLNWSKYSGGNFPYIIRQKPGGRNALGKVKFLFPNEYNIYLHDTPSKGLFGENRRTFSHGCIRVSEPQHLAEWLLRNDSMWTTKKIVEAMNGSKEKYVTLKEKVPVYIGYFTAFVDSDGRLNFREDVYGHDAKLSATLFGGK